MKQKLKTKAGVKGYKHAPSKNKTNKAAAKLAAIKKGKGSR